MSEFLVDGLELLGEVIFLLVLFHLSLDAALDGLVHARGDEFAAQVFIYLAQTLALIEGFQNGLLVQVVHLEAGSHGIGQGARIIEQRKGGQLFGGDAAVLAAGLGKGILQGLHHGGQFRILFQRFFHTHGAQPREGAVAEGGTCVQGEPCGAVQPFAYQLYGIVLKAVGAEHAADHAHLEQVGKAGAFDGGACLRHQKYLLVVFGDGAVDGTHRSRTPDMERHHGMREHHYFTQGNDGQFQRSLFSHRDPQYSRYAIASLPGRKAGKQERNCRGRGRTPGKTVPPFTRRA